MISSVRFCQGRVTSQSRYSPRDGVLGGRHRHLGEAIQLAVRLLLDGLGHPRRFDFLAQFLDFLGLIVAFSQLLLNRLHLLAQEVFALVLANLRLDLRLDARPELEHLELLDQDPVQAVHPRADVERLEHLLLDGGGDSRQAGRNEIGQPTWLRYVGRQRLQIVGQQRRQRHHLLEVRLDVAQQRVDLEVVGVVDGFDGRRDASLQIRTRLRHTVEGQARQSLDNQPQAAVGQLEHLVDVAGGTDAVQIRLLRLLHRGIALGKDANQLARGYGFVNQPDGAFPRHRERHERIREKHGVPQRQNRQLAGNGHGLVPEGEFLQIEPFVAVTHL